MSDDIILMWVRNPSVFSGGKPYFFTATIDDSGNMARVVWHRSCQQYAAVINLQVVGHFTSYRKAQAYVSQLVNTRAKMGLNVLGEKHEAAQ